MRGRNDPETVLQPDSATGMLIAPQTAGYEMKQPQRERVNLVEPRACGRLAAAGVDAAKSGSCLALQLVAMNPEVKASLFRRLPQPQRRLPVALRPTGATRGLSRQRIEQFGG